MGKNALSQSVWGRAADDTKAALKSVWYGVGQVMSLPIIGAFAVLTTPPAISGTATATIFQAASAIVGGLTFLCLVFLVQLATASYRQRNEAREMLKQTHTRQDAKRAELRNQLSLYVIEGTKVLKGFRSILSLGSYWPIKEFKKWHEDVAFILTLNDMTEQNGQWFRRTGIDIGGTPSLEEYQTACEQGLDYLSEMINRLPD